MSEIFIIKDTGKGIINELSPEKVVPIQSPTVDYIPLSGTEEGKPVTGSIIFDFGNGIDKTIFSTDSYQTFDITTAWTNPDDSITNHGYVSIAGSSVEIGHDYEDGENNFLILSSEQIKLADRSNLKGLEGEAYYGANYDDLTYVQKKYVDKQHSYSTTEYKTGGKWVDNKDIYKITKLTSDPAPTVDTMIKSTVVGGTYTEYEYTKP